MQCRKRLSPSEVSSLESNAVCMVCYQRGHYMCKEIKSHFGMHGVSCFNCGLVGHTGYECQRINIDQCQRNPKAAVSEVNRATSASFAEQLNWLQEFNDHERQKQQERGRSRQRGSGGGGRHDPRRGKSTSANQRFRGSSNNNRNQRGNSRGPPPPPPPPPPPVQQTSSSHGKKKGKGKMGGKFAKRGYQARR
uniref:CCHC-type domain-containing protein n=1 Tax=Craspedostauros australis TaxID=1486917 RepID=A0A7R9ZPE4_9STRA|mmetsp:Transcript_4762/g.12511  ORF Transcript_4762/g.12511 Transcript_4762/m.12511 type:complete len:193 (+) Transcript_4762:484-1062(+)